MYRIVIGVTSDVGVPSTYLVFMGVQLPYCVRRCAVGSVLVTHGGVFRGIIS